MSFIKTLIKNYKLYTAIVLVLAGLATALVYSIHAKADSLPNTNAPQGFALTSVASGLFAPTAAQFAPDGRIFVAQKDGKVKIVRDGQVLAQPFYTVQNVNNYVDRGLLGLALDPNFTTNHYVYLLFTYDNNPSNPAGPKTGRLIRVTANGDVAQPGSEQIILGTNVGNSVQTSCLDFPASSDCLPADGLSHAPGSVLFGPDGKMYVSIGDAAGYDDIDMNAFRSQDINNLGGKILRINPDGTAPADNPYYTGSATDNKSKIFALGVRNTFRLSIRPTDGLLVGGEVGWNAWEEVNVISRGANLGWPCYEAVEQQNGNGAPGVGAYKNLPACQAMYQNPPANLTFPINYYPHPPSSAAIGGVFYTGDNYPVQYKNRYFYGDYAKNQIYSLQLTAENTMVPNSNQTFASNVGGPVNFFTGPDGDIYYLAINLGKILHVTYSTGNLAPTAAIAANVTYGPSPLNVNFTSSGSADPEGDPLAFTWEFGDGTPVSHSPNPAHTFTTDGTYTVTLTVTDTFNNSDVKTIDIHAGQTAPNLTINAPTDMFVADPEQVIQFSGLATDVQDGRLPDSALNWQVAIQHCPLDSCHVHNVLSTTGAGGSFVFPHHDGPFYIQVTLTAMNSVGLSSTKSVSIYPRGQAITHAMLFDGINDYAMANAPQDFRLQQFTAEAMIKTLSTDDWGSEVVSMGNNWSVRVTPEGQAQFSFGSNGNWQVLATNNVNIKDGLWHHVAVTRTTNATKLYIDGVLKAQNENTNPISYIYGGNFIVGRHGDGDDHFNFNGAIDEVRVWAAPRSDAQIAQFHATTLPPAQNGLVGYWAAEEGTGQTAVDTSVTAAHNLTFVNGTGWTAGAPLSSPLTPVAQLADTFSGQVVDTAKWDIYQPANRTQQNDTLTITPQTNASGYFGVMSKQAYDLRGGAIFVQVPQTTQTNTSAETQLIAGKDDQNAIAIGFTGGSLHLRSRVAGVNSDTFIPYDASTMSWWRIREVAGVIYLETSPDAATWTVRRSFATPFDVSQTKVIMQAGTWEAVANPGAAVFDSLNTVPPAPAPNKALHFDGSSTAAATTASQGLYNLQTFTLETWAKVEATGEWGGELISSGNNYGLRVSPDGNIRFFMHTGNFAWRDYETTGLHINDATWHHIAVSKAATEVKIYVDGVLVQTFTSTEQISYTLGSNLVLGRHGDGDTHFNLTGSIDEVRIWDSVRTAAQIQSAKAIEIGSQTGLLGYWQNNSIATGVIADQSGHNHTLVLGSGVSLGAGFPRQ